MINWDQSTCSGRQITRYECPDNRPILSRFFAVSRNIYAPLTRPNLPYKHLSLYMRGSTD